MCNLMDISYNIDDDDDAEAINKVMNNMWKYSQTYSIGNIILYLSV